MRKNENTSPRKDKNHIELIYEGVMEAALDAFWYVDQEGRFLEVNSSACKMLGYKRAELMAMKISDIEVVERPEDVLRHIDKIRKSGGDRFETKHRRKDGAVLEVEVSTGSFVEGPDRGFFVCIRDISGWKKMENQLLAREKSQRLLTDNMTDFIWTADLMLNFTYGSPSCERLLGYSSGDVLGLNVRKVLAPASFPRVAKVLAEEVAREILPIPPDPLRARRVELEHLKKDGESVWCEVICTFLRDDKGKASGVIGVTRDITERMELESEARKRLDELEVFYKASVGREERIIELKKEIVELRKKLAKQ